MVFSVGSCLMTAKHLFYYEKRILHANEVLYKETSEKYKLLFPVVWNLCVYDCQLCVGRVLQSVCQCVCRSPCSCQCMNNERSFHFLFLSIFPNSPKNQRMKKTCFHLSREPLSLWDVQQWCLHCGNMTTAVYGISLNAH